MPKVRLSTDPQPKFEGVALPHIRAATDAEIARESMTASKAWIIGDWYVAQKGGMVYISEIKPGAHPSKQ